MKEPRQLFFHASFTVVQLAFVAWLDYITSYEVSLTVFYYVPIAYAAWNLGRYWSFGMSALCAATLTWVELKSGRHYSADWIVAERAFMRLLVFGFVAFSFNHFRTALERERDKVKRLEGMLSVCSCCHRVKDPDGNWLDSETFLRESPLVEPVPKLCPSCAREIYATDKTAGRVNPGKGT